MPRTRRRDRRSRSPKQRWVRPRSNESVSDRGSASAREVHFVGVSSASSPRQRAARASDQARSLSSAQRANSSATASRLWALRPRRRYASTSSGAGETSGSLMPSSAMMRPRHLVASLTASPSCPRNSAELGRARKVQMRKSPSPSRVASSRACYRVGEGGVVATQVGLESAQAGQAAAQVGVLTGFATEADPFGVLRQRRRPAVARHAVQRQLVECAGVAGGGDRESAARRDRTAARSGGEALFDARADHEWSIEQLDLQPWRIVGELDECERVATGRAVQPLGDVRRDTVATVALEKEPRRGRVKPDEAQLGQTGSVEHRVLPVAHGEQHGDPVRQQPTERKEERIGRRTVEPLRIVDHYEARALFGIRREQAERRSADDEPIAWHRRPEGKRPAQRRGLQRRYLLEARQCGSDELEQPGEGDLGLELDATRGEDGHACPLRRVLQQRGLADARLASNEQHRARPPACLRQQGRNACALGLPPDQHTRIVDSIGRSVPPPPRSESAVDRRRPGGSLEATSCEEPQAVGWGSPFMHHARRVVHAGHTHSRWAFAAGVSVDCRRPGYTRLPARPVG